MKLEYPKMLYKSIKEYKVAKDIEEHETMVSQGYMTIDVLRGEKPAILEEKKTLGDLTWHELKALAKEKDISYPRGSSRKEIEDLIRGD